MLLRSSSAPIPNSLLPNSWEYSSPDPEVTLHLPRTLASITRQNFAETRSRSSSNLLKTQQQIIVEEQQQKVYNKTIPSVWKLFSASGLNKQFLDHQEETLVMGDGMGSNGGKIYGGRDTGGGHGKDETDAYYKNMIEINPNNALLLANYAKFLKEICRDYAKAKEYVERAILANPGDADALSLYADLIWQTEKNIDRAEVYFARAIKSDPDDCYVLASYTKFLWDVEEDEDKDCQDKNEQSHTYSPNHF